MRTIETKVYQFDELTEEAKEKARNWYRDGIDFAWSDEAKASINAFIDHFGGKLMEWSISPYSPLDYTVDVDNACFRGLKLKDFDRDHMPTGYYVDCDLWSTFYDEFKRTGSAKKAFDSAVEVGFKVWRADMEWQLTDECVDENIIANEYEFTEDGERA